MWAIVRISSILYMMSGYHVIGKVASHIREHRMRSGLTQEELGAVVGVSRQSVNAIERGRYVPSLPLALRFARIFNCLTDELFELQE